MRRECRCAPLVWGVAAGAVQPPRRRRLEQRDLPSEERDPERNVPEGPPPGDHRCLRLYFLANVGYLNALPPVGRHRRGSPGPGGHGRGGSHRSAARPRRSWPRSSSSRASGAWNGLILAGARVLYAMSRDGLFFPGRPPQRRLHPAERAWPRASGPRCSRCRAATATSRLPDDRVLGFTCSPSWADGDWPGAPELRPAQPRRARGALLYVALVVYVCVGLALVKPAYPLWSLALVLPGCPAFYPLRRRAARSQRDSLPCFAARRARSRNPRIAP
jgi:APA family basic amino acid/polyamine antiporter